MRSLSRLYFFQYFDCFLSAKQFYKEDSAFILNFVSFPTALAIIDSIQCRGIPVNSTGNCFCPRLRNCSRNSANICVRNNNTNNTCTLLNNKCDLERNICEGRDIKRVAQIHCQNFTTNSTKACYCPKLSTCNRNSSSICVISSNQCTLVRNECELEQLRCDGKSKLKLFSKVNKTIFKTSV